MRASLARSLEWSIIGLCVLSLVFIFQPFALPLFSLGAGLVVLGGLAFNLVPLCRPGAPLAGVLRAAAIVLAVFSVAVAIAIGSAHLYGVYLQSQ